VTIFRHGWLVSHDGRLDVHFPVYYIDMELGGQNLDRYIKETYSSDAVLTLKEIWCIMSDIAGGLEYLHKRAIVHRDLKPANGNTPYLIEHLLI